MIQIGTLVRINDVGAHNVDMVGVNDGDFGIVVDSWAEVAERRYVRCGRGTLRHSCVGVYPSTLPTPP